MKQKYSGIYLKADYRLITDICTIMLNVTSTLKLIKTERERRAHIACDA